MKRKLPLLLVALMLLSAMYVPVAYAAPSAGRNDDEIDIADDDVPLIELPTVDIVPEATVDQDGTAAVEVSTDQIMDAVKSVVDGDAVGIAITATAAPGAGNDGATVKTVSAVVPKEALSQKSTFSPATRALSAGKAVRPPWTCPLVPASMSWARATVSFRSTRTGP